MTELAEIVSRLEEEGGKLELRGESIRFAVPSGNSKAHSDWLNSCAKGVKTPPILLLLE